MFICFDHKDYKLNKEIYNPCIYAGKLYYEPFNLKLWKLKNYLKKIKAKIKPDFGN